MACDVLVAKSLEEVEILSAGMRSVVVKAAFTETTVIIKHFRRKDSSTNSGGFGYLREKLGLTYLGQQNPGLFPALLASDDESRIIITEFFTGVSVADYLSGLESSPLPSSDVESPQGPTCTELAQLALERWVDFWVEIVASSGKFSCPVQSAFRQDILQADSHARYPGLMPSPALGIGAILRLLASCRFPGLEHLAHDDKALGGLQERIATTLLPFKDGAFSSLTRMALSPGDFSPHNVLLGEDWTVRGIDAEGSAIHHRLLPLAEMILGFPSSPFFPAYTEGLSAENWKSSAESFYVRLTGRSEASMSSDPELLAAILYQAAVIFEQTTSHGQSPQNYSLAVPSHFRFESLL